MERSDFIGTFCIEFQVQKKSAILLLNRRFCRGIFTPFFTNKNLIRDFTNFHE